MNTTANSARQLIRTYFPNIESVDIMDAEYEVLEPGQTQKLTKQFYWQLTAIGLGKWTKNKRDCDKAARLCVAYVIVRQALSRADNAKALGTVSYLVGGDSSRAHMVNISIERTKDGMKLITSEPEGGRGEFKMTQAERRSVWRAAL